MSRPVFTVKAERGVREGVWVLQCLEHPGAISETKRLPEAEELMREAVAFVASLPQDSFDLTLEIHLTDALDEEVSAAKEATQHAAALQRQAAESLRLVARRLHEGGLTGADAAVVLGVSKQRVSQLLNA